MIEPAYRDPAPTYGKGSGASQHILQTDNNPTSGQVGPLLKILSGVLAQFIAPQAKLEVLYFYNKYYGDFMVSCNKDLTKHKKYAIFNV